MVATSGDRLLRESAEAALRDLLPMADLITPNLPELAMLLGEPEAEDWPAALDQGKRLAGECGNTVLVKGGHLPGAQCPDALINTSGLLRQDVIEVGGPRVQTRNSHGTGCSLSSALATVQARTGDWEASLREVKPWLREALMRLTILKWARGAVRSTISTISGNHPGPGPSLPSCGRKPPWSWKPSKGLPSYGTWGPGSCRSPSSVTTWPRTPFTSTGIPGCLPGQVPSPRPKKSSCSGPGVPNSALTWNPNCTGTG